MHVDVTDTVATHWRAGIQRVVLQVLAQLRADQRLEVRPVVWLESARSFRSLTPHEQASLDPFGSERSATPDPVGKPGRPARVLAAVRPRLGHVRRAVKALLVATRIEPLLRRARSAVMRVSRDRHLVPLVVDLPSGSVLLEMDTVWNNLWLDRSELYEQLHAGGVLVAALVHDLLPQEHPEWFENSLVKVSDRTIRAQVAGADLLLVTSNDGAQRVVSWASDQGLDPVEPTVVTLGADGVAAAPGQDPSDGTGSPAGSPAELPAELEGARFALCVSTIQPRKKHNKLLEPLELN